MSTQPSDNAKEIKSHNNLQQEEPADKATETDKDIKTIEITVESYGNLTPLYPVSDIKAHLKYLDSDVGETNLTPVLADECMQINETFQIQIDVNSIKQIDMLATNPVFLTTFQSSGSFDTSLYEQIKESEVIKPELDVESLFSMYEAFTGEKIHIADMKPSKKKGKSTKPGKKSSEKETKSKSKSTISKSSKVSKKSKSSDSSVHTNKSSETIVKSQVYGICAIDLIPLFYGEISFTEKLLLHPVKKACLLLSTYKKYPEVTITVKVKENVKLFDIVNILNFTIESIFNPPSIMINEMESKVCIMLPLENLPSSPIIFYNPKIVHKAPENEVPKRWPCIHDIEYNANTTKYFVDAEIENIKNRSHLELKQAYKSDLPRIEYNYIKRNVLQKDGLNALATHLTLHRKIVLEIFVTPKTKIKQDFTSDEPDAEAFRIKPGKIPTYLHLMAVLDVASLLYPGITKVRVAAPLKTYTHEEAIKAGLEDSFFLPKPKTETPTTKVSKSKLETVKKKKGSDKKDKSSVSKEEKNLAGQLPSKSEEPSVPEPSITVYDETGQECFIVAEIELLKPIYPKRDVEETKMSVYQLQMEALNRPKTILNKHVAKDFYKQTINDIVIDLNKHYSDYNEKKMAIPQVDYGNFLNYLHQTGAYSTYLASITTAATLIVTNKYKCQEEDLKSKRSYQNLISELFTELVSEMHSVLNSLVCFGMKPPVLKNSYDDVYFFAKEATELKQLSIADRFFLERIINDEQDNPDFWFDYAIFNIEINETEKALECVKEAICIDCIHKNSLILFGILLYEKQNIQEAETCLLNVMIKHSKWSQGWCILYLYYQKCGRVDGMDMALDMAMKYFEHPESKDYFDEFEDLAWSTRNIPNTLFFKTAVLLLKMRLYSWVELALAEEITVPKYYGYVNYILAAVLYYQHNYDHALEHINEAKDFQGGDFAILGLSGHILFAQNHLTDAQKDYFHVIESFDRPDDIHLIYVHCSNILEQLGDDQQARKLILITCKYNQTPYVWLAVGKLYFKQNDVLSAEECFTQANMKDNKNAEVWAYLTLVNLKLNRLDEAEQCYQQSVKNKLNDDILENTIKDEFKKILS